MSIQAASDPKATLQTAVDSTRQVSSVHVDGYTTSTSSASGPTASGTNLRWVASLAGTDSDVTIASAQRTLRTVAVGTRLYQQTPVAAGAGWQVLDRTPVADDTTRVPDCWR